MVQEDAVDIGRDSASGHTIIWAAGVAGADGAIPTCHSIAGSHIVSPDCRCLVRKVFIAGDLRSSRIRQGTLPGVARPPSRRQEPTHGISCAHCGRTDPAVSLLAIRDNLEQLAPPGSDSLILGGPEFRFPGWPCGCSSHHVLVGSAIAAPSAAVGEASRLQRSVRLITEAAAIIDRTVLSQGCVPVRGEGRSLP